MSPIYELHLKSGNSIVCAVGLAQCCALLRWEVRRRSMVVLRIGLDCLENLSTECSFTIRTTLP